jgi:hypothetical protein
LKGGGTVLLPDPPAPWKLKSLVEINPTSWEAHLWSPDEYVYGWGPTAEDAMVDVISRAESGEVYSRCSRPFSNSEKEELEEMLGLSEAPMVIRRI